MRFLNLDPSNFAALNFKIIKFYVRNRARYLRPVLLNSAAISGIAAISKAAFGGVQNFVVRFAAHLIRNLNTDFAADSLLNLINLISSTTDRRLQVASVQNAHSISPRIALKPRGDLR